MSAQVLIPVVIAVVAAAGAGVVPSSAAPMFSVRALTMVSFAVAATIVAAAGIVALAFAARIGLLASLLESCPLIPAHHQVPVWQGLVALLVLGVGGFRVASLRRRWKREVPGASGQRFLVVGDRQPLAFAVPGDPGCVVVSQGLLDLLEPRERQVVFAHERAHLLLHHHRYLYISAVAAAFAPPLGPLARRVRTATERSADEAAVAAVGGDRRLVARTIARVALSSDPAPRALLAFGGGAVAHRVRALIVPGRRARRTGAAGLLVLMFITAVGTSMVQLHHLAEIVLHVCSV